MDLVIDTTVLVDASGQGQQEYARSSYELLRFLADRSDWRLCFDRKGKIENEYRNRISGQMYAQKWLKVCQPRRFVPDPVRLPKGTRVQLEEAHFDWKDLPFVETAWSTATRVIVTREFKSYTPDVIRILRRELRVRVVTAEQLLDSLRGT